MTIIFLFYLNIIFLTHAFTQPKFPISSIPIRSTIDTESRLRIGHGFDIHRLVEHKKLIIGEFFFLLCLILFHYFYFFQLQAGVEVPSNFGADAHSDGDAVYHR
jgi:hypothetical protein